MIVYKDSKVGSDFLSVYCTSQNDGNDNDNIFVKRSSAEGISMGLTKDTYIRPLQTKNISREFFLRKVGKCNMLNEIDLIIERRMAS